MTRNNGIISYLNDLDRQLGALQRLDRPASAGITVTYSGTPTAGAVAYWTGPGTVAHASFGTADVVRTSGAQTVAGDKTFSGTTKIDGTLLLSPGSTQDYEISSDTADALTIQSKGSGKGFDWRYETQDADGTDSIGLSFWAEGKTGSTSNRSRMLLRYNASLGEFVLESEANGTGTLRAIVLSTEGNANQLRVETNGKVAVGGVTSVGASVLGIKAGTSTNDAAVGGTLYSQSLAVGNVGTGEDDLLNFSLPANTLSANGMALRITAIFTPVNNANSKDFRLRFGSTLLNSTGQPTGGSSSPIVFEAFGLRTGATSQRWIHRTNGGATAVVTSAETLSSAVAIRFTGEAVSNNDIVLNQVTIEYIDANT